MILSPRPTCKSRCLTPSSSPAIAGWKYSKGVKTEYLQASSCARKVNQPKLRQNTRYRKASTLRVGWDRDEWEDGRRLSSDPTVSLPGETRRPTPRLERQEAFRAPEGWENDLAVDDAALYRLGILYDNNGNDDDGNAHVRGSGFSLDAIVHAEPTYSLRPAKRRKRSHEPRLKEEDLHLSVNLLSTYLTEDATISRFLASMRGEEPDWFHGGDLDRFDRRREGSVARKGSAEPLPVICECAESSIHSFTPSPAASDFPDLVSDTEEEGGEEYENGGDWALVSDVNADAASLGSDVDVVTNDGETANPVDGAWVFIAGEDS
ncbi:hypothetical protein F5Y09DRAFT_230729 [Xylaria sp. FL1042]|nr:hypothetical protein F5Y09DRAFT_230729 [Xylaria sp. FL1042]